MRKIMIKYSFILFLFILHSQSIVSTAFAQNKSNLNVLKETTERIEKLLEYFNGNGIILKKEILHNGQVVNYVVVTSSTQSYMVKTTFKIFPIGASEVEVKNDLMTTNLYFYYNQHVGIAMAQPWIVGAMNEAQKRELESISSNLSESFLQYNSNGESIDKEK